MRYNKILCGLALASLLGACGDTEGSRAMSGAVVGGIALGAVTGGFGLGVLAGSAAGIMCDDFNPSYCVEQPGN
ncbi:MAG: hypothetical protein AAGF74_00475 [Pseudomonadota bacterium]